MKLRRRASHGCAVAVRGEGWNFGMVETAVGCDALTVAAALLGGLGALAAGFSVGPMAVG